LTQFKDTSEHSELRLEHRFYSISIETSI